MLDSLIDDIENQFEYDKDEDYGDEHDEIKAVSMFWKRHCRSPGHWSWTFLDEYDTVLGQCQVTGLYGSLVQGVYVKIKPKHMIGKENG